MNSSRRCRLKQQSSNHVSPRQSYPSRNATPRLHADAVTVTTDNGFDTAHCNVGVLSDKDTVSSDKENVVLSYNEFIAMSEEIRLLKTTVANSHPQLDTVKSFLGITDTNLFSADDFPPLTGTNSIQRDDNN